MSEPHNSVIFIDVLLSISILIPPASTTHPSFLDGGRRAVNWLLKPLVGDDGRVYTCLDKNLFAFEGNGTIAWSTHLNWTCNPRITPIHGCSGKVRR